MSRSLILLSLLKHAGHINGRVQLQKLMFLLSHNYNIETGYEFVPFKYGPYCKTIQEDLDYLIEYGYIIHKEEKKSNNEIAHKYQITEYGEEFLLENELPPIYEQIIIDLVNNFRSYNTRQLMEYVYKNYPEFTIKSEVKDKYFRPSPELEDFTTADKVLKRKAVIPSNFVNWIEEEIKKAENKLEINSDEKTGKKDFEVDELILSMLEIAYEDISSKSQSISTHLIVEELNESGEINNQIYYILNILENLLSALEEGDLIGVYTEFANTKTNVAMLNEKMNLFKISLKSELIEEIKDFIEDVNYFLLTVDKLVQI